MDLSQARIPMESVGATPRRLKGWLDPDSLPDLMASAPLEGVAEVDLVATREGKRMAVRGWVAAPLRLSCSRCLSGFSIRREVLVERFYLQGEDPFLSHPEWEFEEDDVYLPDGILPLAHVVEEELLLSLEISPHCREECKGLCIHCGANLNLGLCACPPDPDTSPFAVLRDKMRH